MTPEILLSSDFEIVKQQLFKSISRGKTMKCPKCKGRMYSEKLYDFVRSFEAWKCCSCGEVLDPTILANRARNQNLFLG